MLVSDKSRYRGPARGAQGNAFKTLLGIPYALGADVARVLLMCANELSAPDGDLERNNRLGALLDVADDIGQALLDRELAGKESPP